MADTHVQAAYLPSPTPSSASHSSSNLPRPRTRALASGSGKEDMVRRFADDKLSQVSRRYVKKFSEADPNDDVTGFQSFTEVAQELDAVVNVLWKSGTPSLQIPFLLKLAGDFTQYVRSFPPAPRATFDLLRKLDHCFASLLRGRDVDTDEGLPGFEHGVTAAAGMTVTDMVRCRSLAGQTRFLMVELMSMGDMEDENGDGGDDEDEDGDADWGPDRDDVVHLDAARVYERTLAGLNINLGDEMVPDVQQTVC